MNERMSILSYSRFQSNARQDEGVIFLLTSLTMEKLRILFCFVLYSIPEKKAGLNLYSFTTDSNSLYENYKAINSFPKYPLAECGRYDVMFVFNIAREQIMGGDCAALYAY